MHVLTKHRPGDYVLLVSRTYNNISTCFKDIIAATAKNPLLFIF